MSTLIFSKDSILIDARLARFGTSSYPIMNIGSISLREISVQRRSQAMIYFWFLSTVIGVLLAAYLYGEGNIGYVGALIFAGVCGFCAYIVLQVEDLNHYAVVVRTASGDQEALRSPNKDLILQVKDALEKAIIESRR